MKGDKALLWLNIISKATNISITIIGTSHHAFLTLRKSHNSPKSDLLAMKKKSTNLAYKLCYLRFSNFVAKCIWMKDVIFCATDLR